MKCIVFTVVLLFAVLSCTGDVRALHARGSQTDCALKMHSFPVYNSSYSAIDCRPFLQRKHSEREPADPVPEAWYSRSLAVAPDSLMVRANVSKVPLRLTRYRKMAVRAVTLFLVATATLYIMTLLHAQFKTIDVGAIMDQAKSAAVSLLKFREEFNETDKVMQSNLESIELLAGRSAEGLKPLSINDVLLKPLATSAQTQAKVTEESIKKLLAFDGKRSSIR